MSACRGRAIAAVVQRLRLGYRMTGAQSELKQVQPNPGWTPAERVLEPIVGSAYEFRIIEIRETRDVCFERLKEPTRGGFAGLGVARPAALVQAAS